MICQRKRERIFSGAWTVTVSIADQPRGIEAKMQFEDCRDCGEFEMEMWVNE
jgi:hypothetical protein